MTKTRLGSRARISSPICAGRRTDSGGDSPRQSPRLPTSRLLTLGPAHAHLEQRNLARLLIALVLVLATASGCATEFPGDEAELDRFEFPVGIALHPDGRYLYVVSANFNLKYRPQDGGTLIVVDLDNGTIVDGATKTIGSFATDIVLNHDASRGYIAVRGDSSITWFEIGDDPSILDCPLSPGDESLTDCRFSVPSEPTSLSYTRSRRAQPDVDENGIPRLDENGTPITIEREIDVLAIAHLRDGMVSVATIADTTGAQEPPFSSASAVLVEGPSAVAHHVGDRFFVTGRSASSIVGFRPAIGIDGRVSGIFIDQLLAVPTPFNAIQGRSLLFSDDRNRLYVTNQSPNSLMVYDTSAADNDAVSGRHNRIIAQIDLPRAPDTMRWVAQPDGTQLLYVTSYNEDRISIIDPATTSIISDFSVGDGPFDLIIDQRHRDQAYVSNFAENSISIVDISDPMKPVEAGIVSGPSRKER